MSRDQIYLEQAPIRVSFTLSFNEKNIAKTRKSGKDTDEGKRSFSMKTYRKENDGAISAMFRRFPAWFYSRIVLLRDTGRRIRMQNRLELAIRQRSFQPRSELNTSYAQPRER